MMRLPDWECRLHEFLLSKEGVVFTWGETDCALFSADAVRAITGEDLAAEFRGRYRSCAGASRALQRYGAGTLEATIDAKLPTIGKAYARRGDLVMASAGMLGICIGADAVFVGEEQGDGADRHGLVKFARPDWSKAWQVG